MAMPELLELPPDILHGLFRLLPSDEKKALLRTSRGLREAVITRCTHLTVSVTDPDKEMTLPPDAARARLTHGGIQGLCFVHTTLSEAASVARLRSLTCRDCPGLRALPTLLPASLHTLDSSRYRPWDARRTTRDVRMPRARQELYVATCSVRWLLRCRERDNGRRWRHAL